MSSHSSPPQSLPESNSDSEMPNPHPLPSSEDQVKVVGKGLLVITFAKLWFMVGGALITFGLPYLFSWLGESKEAAKQMYGQYFDINNTMSVFSMVLITGGLQAVSKWVSQYENQPILQNQALRKLWTLMLILSIGVGGGFILGSSALAELRGNPDLVNGYRSAGIVLSAYALYVVFIGALNGQKRFFEQALFDISFSTLKVGCVLGAVLLGFGVNGALGGFALAAVLIALAAWKKVGLGATSTFSSTSSEEGNVDTATSLPPTSTLYGFALQVMAYTLVFNLIFKLDVWMVKPEAFELFKTLLGNEGQTNPSLIAQQADSLMGVYGMAVNLSRLPWQATLAVTFVIFPLLSQATFAQDLEESRIYIRQTFRYLTLLIGVAAAGLMALPQAVVSILPPQFDDVALILMWSAPAYFCFSLFNLANTLLMSAGRALSAFFIGLITVLLMLGLYSFWLSGVEDPQMLLIRAAQISLIGFSFGLILGVGRLALLFGPPMPLMSLIRVLIASSAMWGVAQAIHSSSPLILLPCLVGLAVVYFLVLTLLGEWNEQDRSRLARFFKRAS